LLVGDWYDLVRQTRDIFIYKFDENGDSIWRIDIGDEWFDYGTCVTEDEDGFIYVVGRYSNPLTENGLNDVLILKLDANGCTVDTCLISTLLPQIPSTKSFTIYPNPASDRIKVEWSVPSSQGTIIIRDAFGREVFNRKITKGSEIDVEPLLPGVYNAELRLQNESRFGRFIKM
jgi:hypothetical protein